MRRFFSTFIILNIILSIIAATAFAQDALEQGDEVYIKVKSENFRLSPNGSLITTLPQGTKLTVLGENENWVAVQLVGWIYKPSLTKTKSQIKGLTMRALHILVKSREEADEILQALKNGEDFETLAKTRSVGPNAPKGGNLGTINKGDLLPSLDDAIRSLKVNEISDVVESEIGYHIFKRLE